MFVQSQQARLATLYLPLFGLLQENVHRVNVRDASNFNTNQVKHLFVLKFLSVCLPIEQRRFHKPSEMLGWTLLFLLRMGEMNILPASLQQHPKNLLVTLTTAFIRMYLVSSQELVSDDRIKKAGHLLVLLRLSANVFIIWIKFILCVASPHTSTPNIGSVRHADSRGSLVSTDSGNSLHEKTSEKTSSLDKVKQNDREGPNYLVSALFKCNLLLTKYVLKKAHYKSNLTSFCLLKTLYYVQGGSSLPHHMFSEAL